MIVLTLTRGLAYDNLHLVPVVSVTLWVSLSQNVAIKCGNTIIGNKAMHLQMGALLKVYKVILQMAWKLGTLTQ